MCDHLCFLLNLISNRKKLKSEIILILCEVIKLRPSLPKKLLRIMRVEAMGDVRGVQSIVVEQN